MEALSKKTYESLNRVDSSVPLMHQGPSHLELLNMSRSSQMNPRPNYKSSIFIGHISLLLLFSRPGSSRSIFVTCYPLFYQEAEVQSRILY